MSKITNDGLTRFGTGSFIAVPIMTTVGVKGLIYSVPVCRSKYVSNVGPSTTYYDIDAMIFTSLPSFFYGKRLY